jgi:hypothetical protein
VTSARYNSNIEKSLLMNSFQHISYKDKQKINKSVLVLFQYYPIEVTSNKISQDHTYIQRKDLK